MRILFACVLSAIFVVSGARAWAGEEPASVHIRLPREGLSIQAPRGWAIHQYGPAVLKLTQGEAVLWVRRARDGEPAPALRLDKKAKAVAAEVHGGKTPQVSSWEVPGADAAARLSYETAAEAHILGSIALPEGPGFEFEASVPGQAQALYLAAQAMLDSVSVQPFVHPNRHVDWRDGWTLDVPTDWILVRNAQGIARFRSANEPACGIRVHARAADGQTAPAIAARALLDAARLRLKAKGLHMLLDQDSMRTSELTLQNGVRARRVTVTANGQKGRAAGLQIQLEAVATPDLRLLLARPGGDERVLEAGRKVVLTLRKGTHPGPRVAVAAPMGFTRSGAPPVQFRVPAGWTLKEVDNPMRLATLEVPGTPPLSIVIYWFGAGKGGSLASNLARWKSQVRGDSAPKEETIEVAPQVKATILDTHGMYVADMQPGAGHPDVERGQRVLATFLAVPHGPLFVKLIGPVEAVGRIAGEFGTWIRSFRVLKPAVK